MRNTDSPSSRGSVWGCRDGKGNKTYLVFCVVYWSVILPLIRSSASASQHAIVYLGAF